MGNHAVVDDDGHDDNDGHADDSDYDLEIMMMRMITEYPSGSASLVDG